MYVNKCIKCGAEFETKNPKRVICPNCLYAEKKSDVNEGGSEQSSMSSYSSENYQRQTSFGGRDEQQGGYQRREGGYSQGGYSAGGYQRREGGYQRPQQGGYQRDNNRGGFQQRRPQGGGNRFGGGRKPQRPQKPAKPLLITKEQLETIEALYKTMLPLPNPDAHEVIGAKMELEPRKVFFGINLVRQKMMLPKLPYPKRKLAISEDQMLAIKSLYEPLLPLPPIGCHKIIATQLRMDEWRVHVGIGLIRAQMGLDRWNEDRPDRPDEFKNKKEEAKETVVEEVKEEKPKAKRTTKKKAEVEDASADEVVEEKPKKKRTTKKKSEETEVEADVETVEEKPKKRTTRKAKKEDEE